MTGADAEPLTDEEREMLRAALEQQLEDVQRQLVTAKEDNRPVDLDLPIGRLTRIDALQQQQMAAARQRGLQTQLAQIRQAQSKLRDDTYGECVRCGEHIGFARLRVRPEAPFCIRCQPGPRKT